MHYVPGNASKDSKVAEHRLRLAATLPVSFLKSAEPSREIRLS